MRMGILALLILWGSLLDFNNGNESPMTLKCQESGLGVGPHEHVPRPNFNHSSEQQTIVLLLGQPYTGTSITHFLLGVNQNVATLSDANQVGPKKEGWWQTFPDDIETVKLRGKSLKNETRTSRTQSAIEERFGTTVWRDLINNYKRLWDLDRDENGKPKPYQLECTPAELGLLPVLIRAIRENTQLQGQRIALILLTRSPCNQGDNEQGHNTVRAHHQLLQDTNLHGGDIFMLRYEDLYLSGQPGPRQGFLDKELDAYIPGFGKLALDSHPGDVRQHDGTNYNQHSHMNAYAEQKEEVHGHISISANQYFQDVFVPKVPYNNFIDIEEPFELDLVKKAMAYMGYDIRDQ